MLLNLQVLLFRSVFTVTTEVSGGTSIAQSVHKFWLTVEVRGGLAVVLLAIGFIGWNHKLARVFDRSQLVQVVNILGCHGGFSSLRDSIDTRRNRFSGHSRANSRGVEVGHLRAGKLV